MNEQKFKSTIIIPKVKGAIQHMDMRERQEAIELAKFTFKDIFAKKLGLMRISAPHFIESGKGLNDGLTGIEQPVGFYIPASNKHVEVPHSLAKWKREAIAKYGISQNEGIIVDGAYFRPEEEELDNTHSVFVDQWDWELHMQDGQRNSDFLRKKVSLIHEAMLETQEEVIHAHPSLDRMINENLSFVYARELAEMYPTLTPDERELEHVRKHPFTFVQGIGGELPDGTLHGNRAPDYDSWVDELNGDIVTHHPNLDWALELSSMGIRVNNDTLQKQAKIRGTEDNLHHQYHQDILNGRLPQTIGGGIGQSRLAMLMLGATHIGEVQASVHDNEIVKRAKEAGIELL